MVTFSERVLYFFLVLAVNYYWFFSVFSPSNSIFYSTMRLISLLPVFLLLSSQNLHFIGWHKSVSRLVHTSFSCVLRFLFFQIVSFRSSVCFSYLLFGVDVLNIQNPSLVVSFGCSSLVGTYDTMNFLFLDGYPHI